MTSFPTIYLGLQDLAYSFSPDGKRCLVDRWQDLLRVLHDEELPNDWRFQTTCALAHSFLECAEKERDEVWGAAEFQDQIEVIVDRLVDDYNSPLLAWVAEVPSRAAFSEPDHWSFDDHADIIERVRARQYEVIEEMAWHLISYLDENLSE
jgi:hypothetical protein